MKKELTITRTEIQDLDFACSLFDEAIKYQRRKGYPEYRWDDRAAQKNYILEEKHYKVVVDNEIAAIFNVHFQDEKIWRHMDLNSSVYLHGVLVNPKHKGKRIFGHILDWVTDFAHRQKKENIRIDTWADNPDLVNYYKTFGFKKVEDFQIPNTEDISLNCRGNRVTLMEYKFAAISQKKEIINPETSNEL